MKHNILAAITTTILFFASTTYGQTAENKVTNKETQETKNFVDSFIRSYKKTFNLTKVPGTFFIANYRRVNNPPFFRNDFDKMLTSEEKFKDYFSLLDCLSLVLITKLDENNYKLNQDMISPERNDNKYGFFSKRAIQIIQKYPKAEVFLDKSNIYEIKNVEDFRDATQTFRRFVQEIRRSIDEKQKNNFLTFRRQFKSEFFKVAYSLECSKKGEDCEGLPEKTKMFWCEDIPFYLLIAKDHGRLKIVRIEPPSD